MGEICSDEVQKFSQAIKFDTTDSYRGETWINTNYKNNPNQGKFLNVWIRIVRK
jgi:hypothetical protein